MHAVVADHAGGRVLHLHMLTAVDTVGHHLCQFGCSLIWRGRVHTGLRHWRTARGDPLILGLLSSSLHHLRRHHLSFDVLHLMDRYLLSARLLDLRTSILLLLRRRSWCSAGCGCTVLSIGSCRGRYRTKDHLLARVHVHVGW